MLNRNVLQNIPHKPGIYIYKDHDQKIIYVGKAKDLKKRLTSYFNPSNQEKYDKVKCIVDTAEFLDYIVTLNEEEALILEANLIYNYKPKYNVLLKDAKAYPYIMITDEKYPAIKYIRNKNEIPGKFYGPYPDGRFVRDLIEVLQRAYSVRSCERTLTKKSKPCFLYHLGMCHAPCYVEVDVESYMTSVKEVMKVLDGELDDLKTYVEENMKKYAAVMNFEKAAQLRDILIKIDRLFMPIGVELEKEIDIDIIMYEEPIFLLLKIKQGYLMSKLTFTIDGTFEDFAYQYYMVRKNEVPDQILTMEEEEIDPDIVSVLKKAGLRRIAKMSHETNIFKIAFKNLEEEIERYTNVGNVLKQAKEILSLNKLPARIEGIDISHLQGMYTVASLITFENGKPKKDDYRKYRLDEFKEPNDFESIRTVLRRRFPKHELPDLLFIDGGKGQVNSAVQALEEIGFSLKDVNVIGLAKEDERIVFPGDIEDLHLPLDHPVLRMLIYLRDECHRFAIGFNKRLRSKRFEKTKLEEIPGIGKERKKLLIQHFGGIEGIMEASVDEIAEVIKSKAVALKIKEMMKR